MMVAAAGQQVDAAAMAETLAATQPQSQGTLHTVIMMQCRYLALVVRNGVAKQGTPKFDEQLCKTVGIIINLITKARRVNENEAMQINDLLEEYTALLDESNRLKIMQAVDFMMTSDGSAEKNKQILMFFDKYLTQALVEIFASTELAAHVKTKSAAQQLHKMGATDLSEKSFAHCSAVAHHNSNLSSDGKILELRSLKNSVKALKALRAGISGIAEFPKDPAEWINQAPTEARYAFGDIPPVQSPFDDLSRQLLMQEFPCRSSHASLARTKPQRATHAAPHAGPLALGPLFNEMAVRQGLFNQNGAFPQRQGSFNQDAELPNFKDFRVVSPTGNNVTIEQQRAFMLSLGYEPTGSPATRDAPATGPAAASNLVPLADTQSPSPSAAGDSQSPTLAAQPRTVTDIHTITARLHAKFDKTADAETDLEEDDCSTPWHYFD